MSNHQHNLRRLSRERMAIANIEGNNDMDEIDIEREERIRKRNEDKNENKREKEKKEKKRKEKEESKRLDTEIERASPLLKRARSKKRKRRKKKKTAKGKTKATIETREEGMKYEKKTFMQLYERYEDDFLDAVIENTGKPINVEITCVDENKKYKGTILAINRTFYNAYNIILKTNNGIIESINYNPDSKYIFKIGIPTSNIVRTTTSKSLPGTPER